MMPALGRMILAGVEELIDSKRAEYEQFANVIRAEIQLGRARMGQPVYCCPAGTYAVEPLREAIRADRSIAVDALI